MTKFKLIHLMYIVLIIMAFSTGPTPMGISPNGLAGTIIKISSVLLMILFFASVEMRSEKDEEFLDKYINIVNIVLIPYMLLSMWAILTLKEKLIGFTSSGAFYN